MTNSVKEGALQNVVVLLRVLIGWHFLYEGIVKIYNPDWTAMGYLATAQGPLKSVFNALTQDHFISWIDGINMAALIVVGLCFILGVFEKKAAIIAIGLLTMYYLAHPPFPGTLQVNVEGNYWFVNKNLIELVACLVIFYLPTGHRFGIQRLFIKNKKQLNTENI